MFVILIGSTNVCTCQSQYGSVVSKTGDSWDCRTPKEVGCNFNLGQMDEKNVYVIKNIHGSVPVHPPLATETWVQGVSIWNSVPKGLLKTHAGRWDDVTEVVQEKFFLNSEGNNLFFQNISLEVWSGHLIKIDFGEGRCALAKFKGLVLYTVDVEEFKWKVNTTIPIPTPTTTTTTMKCIYKRCIDSWNIFSYELNLINEKDNPNHTTEFKDIDMLNYSRNTLKEKLTKHILSTYTDRLNVIS